MTLREWMDSFDPPKTQEEIAELLQVDQTLVSKWLSGDRSPNLKNAFAIEEMTRGKIKAKSWLPEKGRAA